MDTARLLLLDNALDHGFYRPVEHWARAAGFTPDSVHLPGGEPLPDVTAYSHLIVSGSEDSITQRPVWAEEEARFLAEAIRAGALVLGSCWGHQLLAVALGGPGTVRRSATPEFGWTRIEVLDSGDLLPAGDFSAFVSHFDEVVPGSHPELRVLARSADCAVGAMRWADLPVWGIQAHPEVEPQTGVGFLRGAMDIWPTHAPQFERGLQGPVQDDGAVGALVRRFLGARPRAR